MSKVKVQSGKISSRHRSEGTYHRASVMKGVFRGEPSEAALTTGVLIKAYSVHIASFPNLNDL